MRPPETVELKHGTRGVNVFLLSKLGCETFGSQLLYLWEITVNEVQFRVPHHTRTLARARGMASVHMGTCGTKLGHFLRLYILDGRHDHEPSKLIL